MSAETACPGGLDVEVPMAELLAGDVSVRAAPAAVAAAGREAPVP